MIFEDRFKAYEISPSFVVQVIKSKNDSRLSLEHKELIEKIWLQEVEKSDGKLFNGQLLRFVSMTKEKLIGEFVEYKSYLAQLIEPRLKLILKIEPVGVSGITMSTGKILCGRRSHKVTTYPDHLELAPSGGLDAEFIDHDEINLKDQLLAELVEETGLDQQYVINAVPLLLVHDQERGGYDICVNLQLKPEANQASFQSSHEYATLEWLGKDDLKEMGEIKSSNHHWVPLSIFLIRNYLYVKK